MENAHHTERFDCMYLIHFNTSFFIIIPPRCDDCRNRWHGEILEYRPKFSDGWQSSDQWLDMFLYANSVGNLAAKQAQDRLSREVEEPAPHFNVSIKNMRYFGNF